MPDALKLEKAVLVEMDEDFTTIKSRGRSLTVQFNPETLTVSYSNNLAERRNTGEKGLPSSMQFVGEDTVTLTVDLIFDITAPLSNGNENIDDVSTLTEQVKYFITPRNQSENASPTNASYVQPVLGFHWGTFKFNGVMKSLTEKLEFFSNNGHPLRASMNFVIERQRTNILPKTNAPAGSSAVGTTPLKSAPAGSSVQQIADSVGQGSNWQAIAAANRIENPRMLRPGQLININITVKI